MQFPNPFYGLLAYNRILDVPIVHPGQFSHRQTMANWYAVYPYKALIATSDKRPLDLKTSDRVRSI